MKKLITAMRIVPFMVLNRIICLFARMKENKVLFVSDVRKEIGGNLKFVYDYLPDSFEKVVDFKEDRRYRRRFTDYVKLAYNMTTSKYILLEDFLDYTGFIKVRDGQEICQLWHGAGAYKKFAHSRDTNANEKIKIHSGYKKYAKAIVSAEGIRSCYADAFNISIDKVQATGVPRTDIFFDKSHIAGVREKLFVEYPMLRGKKVLLFAPTYQGTLASDAAYDFAKLDLEQLYQKLKDEYVFVFKWHPAIYNNLMVMDEKPYDLKKYGGFFLDLSQHREINDLLLITDLLVTDYSSVIFDYLLVDKPIVYLVDDLMEYIDGRGLYFDFATYVYGAIVDNQEALINAIIEGDMQPEKREEFRYLFMESCDGKSTEKTCKWIFNL